MQNNRVLQVRPAAVGGADNQGTVMQFGGSWRTLQDLPDFSQFSNDIFFDALDLKSSTGDQDHNKAFQLGAQNYIYFAPNSDMAQWEALVIGLHMNVQNLNVGTDGATGGSFQAITTVCAMMTGDMPADPNAHPITWNNQPDFPSGNLNITLDTGIIPGVHKFPDAGTSFYNMDSSQTIIIRPADALAKWPNSGKKLIGLAVKVKIISGTDCSIIVTGGQLSPQPFLIMQLGDSRQPPTFAVLGRSSPGGSDTDALRRRIYVSKECNDFFVAALAANKGVVGEPDAVVALDYIFVQGVRADHYDTLPLSIAHEFGGDVITFNPSTHQDGHGYYIEYFRNVDDKFTEPFTVCSGSVSYVRGT